MSDAQMLETLAKWLDVARPGPDREVQLDLERIARRLRLLDASIHCPRCNDTGEYLSGQDTHCSAGMVPCDCDALRKLIMRDPAVAAYYGVKKQFTTSVLMIKHKPGGVINYQMEVLVLLAANEHEARGLAVDDAQKENPEHHLEAVVVVEIK